MSTGRPVIAAGNAGYFGPVTAQNFAHGWQVYFGDHDLSAYRANQAAEGYKGRTAQAAQHRSRVPLPAGSVPLPGGNGLSAIEEFVLSGCRVKPGQGDEIVSQPRRHRPAAASRQPASDRIPSAAAPKRQTDLERPLVSVVIPTHNRAQFLDDCLASVFAQTYRPLEVIVIDDYSTDDTAAVMDRWQKTAQEAADLTLVYHRLSRNLGFARAVTIGYMLAQGEFIANHDSDDISHPDRITQQVQFLQLNEDYSLVGTNYEVFTDDYTQRRKSYLVRYDNNIVSCYRAGNHCVCFGSLVMRRQVVERLGGPAAFMQGAEDYEFVARAIVQGFNGRISARPLLLL